MLRSFVVFCAGLSLLCCSRTAPDTKWPAPGPAGGLPYVPLPEPGDAAEPDEDASTPAKPAPPAGIDAALPSAPPTTLARAHSCKDKECKLVEILPNPSFAKAAPSGGDSPGTLWLEDIAPNSVVVLPRHHGLELLAVTLIGEALASGDEGGAVKLEPWAALRAPGLGVNVKAGKDGAKLVMGVAAKNGNLGAALEHAAKKPFEVRWKKRPGPLSHVALAGAKDLSWGAGAFHARIAFGGEAPIPGSLEVLLSAAKADIKEHDHPAWEHIAVLDGRGRMKLAGKEHPVEPGVVFDIPPGEKHAFEAGDRGLVVVQMYTPSGPEQRFIKLAEGEKPAPEPKK